MRIISGRFKGRTIKVPKGKSVRPTTDKNREAIFNYLDNFMDFDGIKICDIYAGSGALGLEALSRGAREADFVEKSYNSIITLKSNIELLNMEKTCKIFRIDALKFSKREEHDRYDLILADPPFFKYDIHNVVKNLLGNYYLNKNGLLLIERSIQTKSEDAEKFGIEPIKKLGDSLIYQFTG